MAGKSVTFFILGTLFGGLGSATFFLTRPEPKAVAQPIAGAAERRPTVKGKAPQPSSQAKPACPPPWLPALAAAVSPSTPARGPLPDPGEVEQVAFEEPQDWELEHEENWTAQDNAEFIAQELEFFRRRQDHIERMRVKLKRAAELSAQEQFEFGQLVKQASETLQAGEKRIQELMKQEREGAAQEGEQGPFMTRKVMLETELERLHTLVEAQNKFERLLGKERMRALGPGLRSVEAFVQDEVWEEPPPMPVKGAGPDLIR